MKFCEIFCFLIGLIMMLVGLLVPEFRIPLSKDVSINTNTNNTINTTIINTTHNNTYNTSINSLINNTDSKTLYTPYRPVYYPYYTRGGSGGSINLPCSPNVQINDECVNSAGTAIFAVGLVFVTLSLIVMCLDCIIENQQ